MAYLDLDNMTAALGMSRAPEPSAEPPAGFSPLEWSVIALAQRDTMRSLSAPGRLSRALGTVFGTGASSLLADPRLEALRRVAVHAWHRGFALPMAEIRRFLAAGFSEAQLETLVVSVTGMRLEAERPRGGAK